MPGAVGGDDGGAWLQSFLCRTGAGQQPQVAALDAGPQLLLARRIFQQEQDQADSEQPATRAAISVRRHGVVERGQVSQWSR